MSCSGRRISTCLGLTTLLVTALAPASAQAQIVTVGNPLVGTFTPSTIGGTSTTTLLTSATPNPGAQLRSPINGVIVRWRLSGFAGGPFTLRVLTPSTNTTNAFTATGASTPQTPQGTATQTFTANVPIKQGQTIAVDTTAGSDQVGALPGAVNSSFSFLQPKIANGDTRTFTGPSSAIGAIGLNADVATVPPNDFDITKVKKNKNKGTAVITVDVPGPGKLELSGAGVKPQRSLGGATSSKEVTEAGPVTLKIKAKGKKKAKLASRGKVKVKVNVTFTPTGDAPGIGVPNTEPQKIKLVDN